MTTDEEYPATADQHDALATTDGCPAVYLDPAEVGPTGQMRTISVNRGGIRYPLASETGPGNFEWFSAGAERIREAVAAEPEINTGTLTASGGWCAPSETLYDLVGGSSGSSGSSTSIGFQTQDEETRDMGRIVAMMGRMPDDVAARVARYIADRYSS